jgi:general secretion pathway protein D
MLKPLLFGMVALLVYGCAEIEPKPFAPASGHIKSDEKPAGQIPELVQKTPVLPAPQPPVELEKYTVVVNEVPAKELLFALARDAKVNVDIDPAIDGVVTINAVDQTLPQILERISRQVDMRYEFKGDNLLIQPDAPYLKTYTINYINLSRDTVNTNTVATSLATTGISVDGGGGGGGSPEGAFGGNNSTTELTSKSLNQFWLSIVNSILFILQEDVSEQASVQSVIPNPESGLVSVFATARQHDQIQEFIDNVMANVRRQVLIQVTIIDVELSDQYQAGIDWELLDLGNFVITSTTLGTGFGALATAAISGADAFVATYDSGDGNKATLQLLDEFGDVKVLSSPQLMALNNQTAVLKRVQNKVFFTIESDTVTPGVGATTQSFDTTVHTLPVGIVMTITPHIAENGEIILLVRPTISREVGEPKQIPLPPDVPPLPDNAVPETVSQEMESLIRLNSGQTAILGGLMEDRASLTDTGVPGTSMLGILGNLFKTRSIEYRKTETVIFIRPLVVNSPSIETDLQLYKPFLEETSSTAVPGQSEVTRP